MLSILKLLKNERIITEADYYFAKFIDEKQQSENYSAEIKNLAVFLAALCHFNYQQGHTCLKLNNSVLYSAFGLLKNNNKIITDIQEKINYLAVTEWETALSQHIAFSSTPLTKIAPFVFQFNTLYFYRTWQDEYRVASYFIQNFSENNNESIEKLSKKLPHFNQYNEKDIAEKLAIYFPQSYSSLAEGETHHWQKIAVAVAVRQPFCLITGGPGTGKTTTVAKLLLVLQSLHQNQLQIKLVAPTGKASARLTESIENSLVDLQKRENIVIDPELKTSIPTKAETIHRLLGVRYFEDSTKYNAQNPLQIDVLVVDEASMIDLSLMAKLLQALKPNTKLILLGDKDQLSSVEAGAVLAEMGYFSLQGYSNDLVNYIQYTTGEILMATAEGNPIRDCLCNLVVSRRFGNKPYIGKLANAINQCQAKESWHLFSEHLSQVTSDKALEIELKNFDNLYDKRSQEKQYHKKCLEWIVKSAVENYQEYLRLIQHIQENKLPIQDNIQQIFKAFNKVRFLTALRVGEFGSENLNQLIAERLRQKGLVTFNQTRDWYVGKPIIINQNDSSVGLYNGDIGLYLTEVDISGKVKGRFWFENGKSELASRLPSNDPAFAMTVHKSQGSEFAHTFLILPLEPNPVLTKELVYTGVTRAKEKITIFSKQSIWESAVRKQTERQSGLGALLDRLY
ncbi:DNA helicase/exodeoxyribonuclease V alpha subunit [Bisgaardia hudsonensis]|uniref:RecBCD enzyme subunit RecD n=1 Tax=Bisgaardia hudsonensis TaxID=109472 RepID=A0A4R2N144_9PAST|nr:exodeoxyribonuclease V subunit alpha [Bisgaardia hudsonensis]QLB13154.1 exodeoxyribonuclease V subunit alpha [Bisgaardia hudsonensis]TCP13275.1 DNA helicase/exodeoxyribonuclease V alpha subunit [Bisgaardia hudsonensis]